MQAVDIPFTKIINGTTQFVIPVFQRDYSWEEEQCRQLWDDIVQIASATDDRRHFVGSVVYVATGDTSAGFTRWLLIDGQQRLTTLTLLLIALRDHIEESGWTGSEDGPTAKRIDAYFLQNMEESGARRYKLVLRRHDNSTLEALINKEEMLAEGSPMIIDNYQHFRDWLASTDPEMIYQGVGRLVVVDVKLDRKSDDPQLVFESLNSTGVDLSQSDLIRNFILMRLREEEQTRLYNQYWSKIEKLFRGHGRVFDAFIRDFIALKTRANKQEKADRIYIAFRREFEEQLLVEESLEAFLGEMLRFAKYHAAFSIGVCDFERLREPLSRLRRLVDVPAILVMRLFEFNAQNPDFSIEQFSEAVELVESYVFRRAICGSQTRGYWATFASLSYRISEDDPLNSLKVRLALMPENYRFPDDDEFGRALRERDIYDLRVCFDLLERLENYQNREPTDTSKLSIEHILPQNEKLPKEWQEMLGSEWQSIQKSWLHKLGNLTLTGYNSTYSDRPFDEKKTITGGFAESAVRLNRYVREKDQWTDAEIQERGRVLAKQATNIWRTLEVQLALIESAKEADMRERAQKRDIAKVPMSKNAKPLFEKLRREILSLDPAVIELAENKSVSYHAPTFFLEVLPRQRRLGLLLPLEASDIDDPHAIAEDTAQWKFFVNAVYDGGIFIRINDESDIQKAMPIIRKAFEEAKS
ncbi:MAG: DUF262 and DUF1524 domain-containing protein [Planctomycetaceae bacterium]